MAWQTLLSEAEVAWMRGGCEYISGRVPDCAGARIKRVEERGKTYDRCFDVPAAADLVTCEYEGKVTARLEQGR